MPHPARQQRLRLLFRSFSSHTGVLSQDTELIAPHADLPPLGHESVALDKLLSLPERQQLEEAGAGLQLWDKEGEEEREERVGRGGERDIFVVPRQRSEGDRKRREEGVACGLLVDMNAGGGGGRRGRELPPGRPPAPASAPPTVALPLVYSQAAQR